MDVTVLLSFSVVGAVTAAVLRRYRPEYALFAGIAAAVTAVAAALSAFSPVMSLLRQLADILPESSEYLTSLLKCAGTAILSETASGICTDCGETALAKTASLTGRVGILILAIPVFTSLTETVLNVINT